MLFSHFSICVRKVFLISSDKIFSPDNCSKFNQDNNGVDANCNKCSGVINNLFDMFQFPHHQAYEAYTF